MRNPEEILNELRSISPLIASMEKVNPWTVPDGYFDKLAEGIAGRVKYEYPQQTSLEGKVAGQQVPEGYFDHLSESILSRIRAQEMEEGLRDSEFPVLESLRKVPVFKVPEGYFDQLGDQVLDKIKRAGDSGNATGNDPELPEILLKLRAVNVFKVPEGYFEQLSGHLLEETRLISGAGATAAGELQEIAPALSGLRDLNVFEVPQGYFNRLPGQILDAVVDPPKAKVIPMRSRSTWIRYAVAASVTGIITFFSLQYLRDQNTAEPDTNTAQTESRFPEYVKESLKYKDAQDLNAGIAQLSDAEIIKYLEKNGNIMDNEMLMSNSDESGLPSQTDYLNDTNTLNDYLQKIKNEQVKNSTP